MGGDDLESDDEYLVPSVIDDSGKEKREIEHKSEIPSKRSRNDGDDAAAVETKRRRKKNKTISNIDFSNPLGKRKLLLHSARGIGQESLDVQAAFLWTCYTHALGGTDPAMVGEKFKPSSFLSWSENIPTSQVAWTNDERDSKYPSILKQCVSTASSMKKLKEWNVKKSPMVIILCVSARRCVAVLKAISSLKIRCAKLFAKHLDLQDQISQLSSSPFPIGIGTPNRLSKLCLDGALNLQSTELVFIDGHEDSKAFTVLTLNDTALEVAKFIHEYVKPQIGARPQNIKFVMC